jgi:hypothetical protein
VSALRAEAAGAGGAARKHPRAGRTQARRGASSGAHDARRGQDSRSRPAAAGREPSARRRDPRDYDDDLPPRRRATARGAIPPGDPLASVHFGLSFFWWKNLLLIIAMLASFLPAGFSELAGSGHVFAILVVLVVGVGGLCSVAALVFGAIGGVACNRLPHELRDARRFSSPLRTLEIVFPCILLLTAFFLVLITMLTRRRAGQPPVTGYEFLGIGFLAFAVLAFVCWLATYVLLMLFLRSLAQRYDDEETAAKSIWVMVAFLIAAIVGPVAVFFTGLIARMLGLGMVPAFITISAVSVVVTVIWAWILFKILQTITAVRRHVAGAVRTNTYAPARE